MVVGPLGNLYMEDIRLGKKIIGHKHPAYIIAEIGLNHQGDIVLAKKLIDIAVEAGADCVKFQKRNLSKLYKKEVLENPQQQEHSLQYLIGHIIKSELTEEEMFVLYDYSQHKGVDFLCTPWDEDSLRALDKLNLPAYKIGSPDMFNLPLMKSIILQKKTLVISTGMSFVSEIDQLISYLNDHNARYILLHCNSTYPAPYHDINLEFIKVLKEKSRYPVGFSGHEQGITVALAAVALGARIIEKHLTTDRNLSGPDHKASLEPSEFKTMVEQIRILEASLGEPVRYPSRGEFINRENLSKSLVANRDICKGEVLKYEDIALRSPGKGTNPLKLRYFIGRSLIARNLVAGDYILESDVEFYESAPLRNMDFKHRWGIAARMSDIDELLPKTKPTFVEIHLTDGDIIADRDYSSHYDVDLVVHGPEYYGDLLLDLSSLDEGVREKSIVFFNQALDHARKLKNLFRNKNELVKFVVHPGGMNMEGALNKHIDKLNDNLSDSLKKLNAEGLELMIENMPPLPWYFGGRWFHSSFMDADEIVQCSKKTGLGIVLDISHAALYCNYACKNLEDYIVKLLPVVKYVHIADAAKYNGEGLKIGDGTVDFNCILTHLVKTNLWFLPEVWQGHKFGGEDFLATIRSLKLINRDF